MTIPTHLPTYLLEKDKNCLISISQLSVGSRIGSKMKRSTRTFWRTSERNVANMAQFGPLKSPGRCRAWMFPGSEKSSSSLAASPNARRPSCRWQAESFRTESSSLPTSTQTNTIAENFKSLLKVMNKFISFTLLF